MWPLLSSFALFGTLTAIPLLLWRNRSLEKLLRAQDQQYVDQESRLKLGLKQSELAFQQLELRHRELRRRLEEAGIYESFRQPVLLVGPRGVGKTSLLTHWRTPWSKARPSPTFRHNFAEVPVCNLPLPERRPHFADPDLMVPVIAQLLLRVHDFAGEVNAQKLVEKVIREETAELRRASQHDLGVVIVCMFDAGEVVKGISPETQRYYNGELFQRLRGMMFDANVKIERLILVFNKYDRLRQGRPPAVTDVDLLDECLGRFINEFRELPRLCNPGRMTGVLTMLDRENNRALTRGGPIVFGEAARSLIEAFGNPDLAKGVVGDTARPVPAQLLAQDAPRAASGG